MKHPVPGAFCEVSLACRFCAADGLPPPSPDEVCLQCRRLQRCEWDGFIRVLGRVAVPLPPKTRNSLLTGLQRKVLSGPMGIALCVFVGGVCDHGTCSGLKPKESCSYLPLGLGQLRGGMVDIPLASSFTASLLLRGSGFYEAICQFVNLARANLKSNGSHEEEQIPGRVFLGVTKDGPIDGLRGM